ncbi:hypothetical protein D917_06568 [Trichinella nativa]|uniref:Protein strawberry notch-like protein 1 n=1 Tax=Trichinella nativa TaxID=6335 RepID=A0A1Y3EWQ7_9BILA|nr:hypothetical protein D917_06568 [Trichinella nativa]
MNLRVIFKNSEEDDLLSAAMSDAGLDVILNDSTQSYAASQTDFELCSTKNTVSQALNIPENSTVHPPGIGTSQQQVPVVPTSVQLKCGSGKSVRIVLRKSAANKPTILLQGKQLAMISKIPPNRLVLHKNSSGPRFAAPTTLNTSTNGVNAKNTQLTSTVFKPVVNTSRNALPAQQYAQSDFVRPTQLEKFRNPNLRMPVIMRQPRMPSYQQPLQRSKNATWTSRTSNANAANLGSGNTFSSTVSENPYYNADETMQAEIEEAEGDFEMCHANTYADYVPSKLRSGLSHPDAVVETSSLASVQPPDIWYHVSIPEEIIDHGFISALQLETIIYACQQHETFLPSGERSGYLIGDGPGVGKGRTIAGIIYENYLLGRKRSLWFSVSSDLKYDAQRDLEDVGAQKIKVHALNKFKYTKVSGKENGSVKKGVIFATYASLIGESQNAKSKYRTRMKQLLHWCGSRFDGVIVLDECHRAKNLCPVGSSRPSKTGQTVMELQKALPKARIVYASATGATEPRHMAYMVRLGLWGTGRAFSDFNSFISAVERRGVGAMEIIAMDMKLRGLYLARQLSFSGVSFRVEEVPLSAEFIQMYDSAVKLWLETRKQFQMVTDMLNINSAGRKAMWGQFWASHQRFFKYLCIAAKVNACVRLARESVRNGKCVVIGLQSTGEARTLEQLGDCGGELTDFISTAKGVFQSLVEKHFPTSDRYGMSTSMLGIKRSSSTAFGRVDLSWKQNLRREKCKRPNSDLTALSEESDEDQNPWEMKLKRAGKKSKKKKRPLHSSNSEDGDTWPDEEPTDRKVDKQDSLANHVAMSAAEFLGSGNSFLCSDLLVAIERLGEALPPNTLDQLIDELGGPDYVAEMTGRKGRVVSNDEGQVQYELRHDADVPLEMLNLKEKERFMTGEKRIAIISEAASSGISLHSDRRAPNQRRRVHITLELPWSADKAIQQFGRTHRSNQINSPEYVFLISELAGEQRFASVVAKRLESLGALTHGDRRATETRDLSQFNLDTKYGRTALEVTLKSIVGWQKPLVEPPKEYAGNFFQGNQIVFIL